MPASPRCFILVTFKRLLEARLVIQRCRQRTAWAVRRTSLVHLLRSLPRRHHYLMGIRWQVMLVPRR